MEPRAAPPEHRLRAIRLLRDAGVPVGVNIAPVIPGLTEHEIPSILEASAAAGAESAAMLVLRLPGVVESIFVGWLREHLPDRAERVLNRLRELHGGKLSDPRFGHRMRGSGEYADQMRQLFKVTRRRLGLDGPTEPLATAAFQRPRLPRSRPVSEQLDLLGEEHPRV